jgi:MATE family multidrug resistance protein
LQTAIVSCVLAAGPRLVGIFAADPAIVSSCTAVLPLLGCLMFADGIISVGSGVLRGAGRQNLGAGINALGYWAIGIPVSGFLGLKMGLGVPGFWMGVGAGGLLQAIIMLTMISRWDWQKEVERVQGIVAQQGKLTVSYGH